MRVHVFIATTAGPVRVQSIRRIKPFDDGPANASHVAVDNEGAAHFSSRYRQFVDFVIGPRYRHGSFLVSVGRDIEQGESWRLPLLLAHQVEAMDANALAAADPVLGRDQVVLASGRVGNDLNIRAVQGMAEKFAPDVQASIESWLAAGANVAVAVPAANAAELDALDATCQQHAGRLRVVAAEHVEDLLAQLPLAAAAGAPVQAPGRSAALTGTRLLAAAGALALAVTAAAGAWLWFGADEAPKPQPIAVPLPVERDPPQPRARTALIAVRDQAGQCEPDHGRALPQTGNRFASAHTHGLCAMVLRPAAHVRAAAWLDLNPLGVPPFRRRGDDWWLPPPRQGGDRQLALLLAEAPADQAALNTWLKAWLSTRPRGQSPGTVLEALRRSAATAPWRLTVYHHALEAF